MHGDLRTAVRDVLVAAPHQAIVAQKKHVELVIDSNQQHFHIRVDFAQSEHTVLCWSSTTDYAYVRVCVCLCVRLCVRVRVRVRVRVCLCLCLCLCVSPGDLSDPTLGVTHGCVANCPIMSTAGAASSPSMLPANPFIAKITDGGKCTCIPPQVCDA